MTYPTHPIPTTVVGSYPQPDWLIDRAALEKHGVPRVHAHEIWRIPGSHLKEAQDDATILAIRELERIGIDIVSDGEMRRESYSNYFSLALDGVDSERLGSVIGANGRATPVARVTGRIRRKGPVEIADAAFLVEHAAHATKITLPGPFTMSQQVQNEFYKDEAELAMDYADAVNAELKELKAAGVDVVQLDEPWVRAAPDKAAAYGVAAIDRALAGIDGPTVVHICLGYGHLVKNKPSGYAFLPQLADSLARQVSLEAAQPQLDLGVLKELSNKTILLGVLDLGSERVETADEVAARLRAGLKHVAADRLVAAPDCGMKYLPRARAFGKLRAMVEGAAIVRREVGA
ncbi:MAG TPA: 5-methyltetrahydropteroyltriglutamate--homocysteine methyltransferase [Stellaceae bacterium]|nr:5-methyltetrahydropteroyltriglutamate--homocysteine methyltransferase [Stellaceae bacterium]